MQYMEIDVVNWNNLHLNSSRARNINSLLFVSIFEGVHDTGSNVSRTK